MTYNEHLYKKFYDKICEIIGSETIQKTNFSEAKGNLRLADIYEYQYKKGIYIYVIRERESEDTRKEIFRTVLTASQQIDNMQRHIKNFELLSSAVKGSYISFERTEGRAATICFRLNASNDEIMQGKLTERQNNSIDSDKSINKYQDNEGLIDDSVGLVIKELLKEHIALEAISKGLASILTSTCEFDPNLTKDLVEYYDRNSLNIKGLGGGVKRWTSRDRH